VQKASRVPFFCVQLEECRNTIGVGVNRSGAFAEFLAIPAKNVYKPSRAMSTDLLAC
jgi:hypothetical protein